MNRLKKSMSVYVERQSSELVKYGQEKQEKY